MFIDWSNCYPLFVLMQYEKNPIFYFKKKRSLNKFIWIQTRGNKLSNIFDQLIHTTPSTAASSSYKRAILSGKGCQSEEAASSAVKHNYCE